ncbi:restriction endonuclease subunit S [Clostridium sp. Marseille-Q7071]
MSESNINVPKMRFPGFDDAWEQRRLKDVANYIRGSFPQPYTNPEWFDEENGKPFVQVADIGYDLKLNEDTRFHISNLAEKQSRFVEKGKVIVALQGSIETSIGRTAITQYDAYVDRTILIFESYKVEIDKQYFAQVIKELFRKEKEKAWGATISTITKDYLNDFLIGLPSYKEQQKIGDFFASLDTLITLHQRKLNHLKDEKKGLLQKMFPKNGEDFPELRFPGFTDAWEQRKLGDNAIIKGRLGWKSLKQNEYTDEGPSMIAGKHISDGIIDWTKVDHIPQWRYDESPEIMLEDGDVIFSKDGSLGNPALIDNLKDLATINSTMMLVRTDETIDSKFFYQVLRSDQFKRLIYLKVSGSSIPHLFQADMNDFQFIAPSVEEQKKIGEFFEELDHLITLHQHKLNHLQERKRALLQQMFV